MNAQNAKDFLPLVQALADGKTIQMIYGDGTWRDHPHLDLSGCPKDYRIKPEPRRWWLCFGNQVARVFTDLKSAEQCISNNYAKTVVEVVEVLK